MKVGVSSSSQWLEVSSSAFMNSMASCTLSIPKPWELILLHAGINLKSLKTSEDPEDLTAV